MNETTTAPTMEEAVAILDEVSGYQAVDDSRKALGFLRDVVDGKIVDSQHLQERLNAASMLYQVAAQRETLALQAIQLAQQAHAAEQAH